MTLFDIMAQLINPYDYKEYLNSCADANLIPVPWCEFAQKMLTILKARVDFPDMPLYDAYIRVIKENKNTLINDDIKIVASAPKEGCGSCGGGRVR